MKVKIAASTNKVLDYLVAKCEGRALRAAVRATDEEVAKLRLPTTLFDVDYSDGVWRVVEITVTRHGCLPGCSLPSITAFCNGKPFQSTADSFFTGREEAELDCLASNEGDLEGYSPSTDWAQGGPIIEREKIGVLPDDGHRFSQWRAFCWHPSQHDLTFEDATSHMEAGPTALIAAMRCFVVSKLGDEVDVPGELLA